MKKESIQPIDASQAREMTYQHISRDKKIVDLFKKIHQAIEDQKFFVELDGGRNYFSNEQLSYIESKNYHVSQESYIDKITISWE